MDQWVLLTLMSLSFLQHTLHFCKQATFTAVFLCSCFSSLMCSPELTTDDSPQFTVRMQFRMLPCCLVFPKVGHHHLSYCRCVLSRMFRGRACYDTKWPLYRYIVQSHKNQYNSDISAINFAIILLLWHFVFGDIVQTVSANLCFYYWDFSSEWSWKAQQCLEQRKVRRQKENTGRGRISAGQYYLLEMCGSVSVEREGSFLHGSVHYFVFVFLLKKKCCISCY